jgi:hypothetical protein
MGLSLRVGSILLSMIRRYIITLPRQFFFCRRQHLKECKFFNIKLLRLAACVEYWYICPYGAGVICLER